MDFGLIREAYSQTEQHFNKIINAEKVKGSQFLQFSRINEYAYFVLFWGQFESFIHNKAMEIEGDHYKELSFMVRVRLLISPKHEYYLFIDKYYYWRCKLAHGSITDYPELTLPTIFDKIEEIVEAINNNSMSLGGSFEDLFNEHE